MLIVAKFSSTGRDQTYSVNSGGVTDVTLFASPISGSGASPFRQGLWITNCDTAANVYLSVRSTATDPGTSATNYTVNLTPKSNIVIQSELNVHVFCTTDTVGSTNLRVVELI